MPNPIPGADDVLRRELPNGIVILARENFDAQSVVVVGSFAAGAVFENPAQAGLAAITAEGLLRGTQTRDYNAIHETLESAGMSLDFNGGRHMAAFDGKALAEDLPILLEMLGDALRNPVFPEEHIELIKGEVITGLRYQLQDTRYMASKIFQELAYPPEHIYHRTATGDIETVSAITAADLHRFHAAQYGPGKLIIVIVGAVSAEKAAAEVERALGDWRNPQQQIEWNQPNVPALTEIKQRAIALPGKSQSDIILGVPGPSRTEKHFQAANLANNILGVFGMMGRLGASVREEQGLAYYSYSSIEGGLGPGAWRVSAGVNSTNVKRAIASIRVEIERMINELVSADDLQDNKSNLVSRLPLRLETNEGVASNLLAMERFGLGLDYLRNYEREINAITVEDLQQVMRTYWNPTAFAVSVAGSEMSEPLL